MKKVEKDVTKPKSFYSGKEARKRRSVKKKKSMVHRASLCADGGMETGGRGEPPKRE